MHLIILATFAIAVLLLANMKRPQERWQCSIKTKLTDGSYLYGTGRGKSPIAAAQSACRVVERQHNRRGR